MTSQQAHQRFTDSDIARLDELERVADPRDKEQQALLEEMRSHVKKLQELRKGEDPRLSFSTPEFKDAQRVFTENFKRNFGQPVEYALVKEYPWSTPQLRKLDKQVDVDGNPWPEDSTVVSASK